MHLKKISYTAIKAFIIGSTMTVPGVSGGSMAMILGEYNTLIESIPGLLKKDRFKESFIYLLTFLIAGLLGVFLISKPLSMLLESSYMIVMYFFIGAVIATVPTIVRASGITEKREKAATYIPYLLYAVAGAILVYSIRFIPEGIFTPSLELSISSILSQIIGGFLLSIGFVLPGISISYLLIVVGLYETILNAVSSLDILPLIPLGIGGIIGIFTLTGFLTWAMEKHPKVTYLIILGFLIGSIASVFPGLPSGIDILWCLISSIIGFSAIYMLSRAERNRNQA